MVIHMVSVLFGLSTLLINPMTLVFVLLVACLTFVMADVSGVDGVDFDIRIAFRIFNGVTTLKSSTTMNELTMVISIVVNIVS